MLRWARGKTNNMACCVRVNEGRGDTTRKMLTMQLHRKRRRGGPGKDGQTTSERM